MIKFKIATTLNKETIIKRVSELLLEDNRLAGNVSDDKFKIRKIPLMLVKNHFLPVFEGKIEEGNNGSIVFIKARLHYFTSIILAIWVLVFGSAVLVLEGSDLMWIIAAMAVIGLMMVIRFFIPTTQVINKLKSLLN